LSSFPAWFQGSSLGIRWTEGSAFGTSQIVEQAGGDQRASTVWRRRLRWAASLPGSQAPALEPAGRKAPPSA
ncbi:hypothetical protein, partial [Roseiconus nitratireducens]|uniref:hypothetical protein n=1 Tax=Roseiconus nitratireducens TaxID=2605748 RepID=UPI001F409A2D